MNVVLTFNYCSKKKTKFYKLKADDRRKPISKTNADTDGQNRT